MRNDKTLRIVVEYEHMGQKRTKTWVTPYEARLICTDPAIRPTQWTLKWWGGSHTEHFDPPEAVDNDENPCIVLSYD